MSSRPAAEPARRPWSIARRLTVWYAAAAFALVLGATGYLYWALARNLDEEDDQFLADKVQGVARLAARGPADEAPLRQEVGAGGADRGAARFLTRVSFPGHPGRPAVETPGMSAALPPAVFPAAGGGGHPPAADHRTADGRVFRLRTHADTPDGAYLIHAAMDRTHDDELLTDYRHQLSYVLGGSLVAAVGGGYWVARRGVRPIADVAATARRIGPTRLGERIAAAGLPAEVRELADTVNHMLDRLADAFARLGRFSADIAHELRTPLNNLRGEAEVALGRPRTPDEYRDALGSCLEECGRLARLTDSLLFLARAEDPKTQLVAAPVDLADELHRAREFFAPAAAEAGVHLVVEAAPGLGVRADRDLLQQAVGNLVMNAIAHTPAGGTATLFAAPGAGGARVGVRDTGPGIPAEHLPYVFDRFYRADAARSAGQGRVGLGLAIVRGIAELHGGSVAAESPPGRGVTVSLVLPGGAG